jgi:hypothetical protein
MMGRSSGTSDLPPRFESRVGGSRPPGLRQADRLPAGTARRRCFAARMLLAEAAEAGSVGPRTQIEIEDRLDISGQPGPFGDGTCQSGH